MRCLEVAVNGERFCLAGAAHVPMFCASVTRGGPDDATDGDKTSLTVHGLSCDVGTDYYWGAERFALMAGDIVTIRVVDEATAENPTPFPVPPILAKLRERHRALSRKRAALRESFTGLDQSALEEQSRASLKRLFFWCALVVLDLALWFFAS
jgi:hypothetical protein